MRATKIQEGANRLYTQGRSTKGYIRAERIDSTVVLSPGDILVITGDYRAATRNIPITWHCGPLFREDRQLVLVSFLNP